MSRVGVDGTLVTPVFQRLLERHRARNFLVHRLDDSVDILRDVVIPEADHTVAFGLEPTGPHQIRLGNRTLGMLRAIDLDYQMCRHTSKVHDVTTDRHLPPEVGPEHRRTTQITPKKRFRAG